jgi:hypothetical protein
VKKSGITGKPDHSFQELFSEALNDLFAKYDAPTISE